MVHSRFTVDPVVLFKKKSSIKTLLIMAFKFENLKVWEKAVELSGEISDAVKKFPKDELFILTAQIKPATDSISLNIAEGSTGLSTPEFKRFLGHALRSAIEVVGCLFLAKRRKLLAKMSLKSFILS